MALKRAQGVKIKDHAFNRVLLTRLLLESDTNLTRDMINTWFGEGEEDAQNVSAMTKLPIALASFCSKSVSDFPEESQTPMFPTQLAELKIIGHISACIFQFITMQSVTTAAARRQPFLSVGSLNQCASESPTSTLSASARTALPSCRANTTTMCRSQYAASL